MEVADSIVLINEGRVEQVGEPDDLYDHPANDFVMGFLGEVATLNGVTLRPHDIEVSLAPVLAGGVSGLVTRVMRVGFEVRILVHTEDGAEVPVILTRHQARVLALTEGMPVWLTPANGATVIPRMAAGAAVGEPVGRW